MIEWAVADVAKTIKAQVQFDEITIIGQWRPGDIIYFVFW